MIRSNLAKIHMLKPFMPPLVGTPAEREALAVFLDHLSAEERAALQLGAAPAHDSEEVAAAP